MLGCWLWMAYWSRGRLEASRDWISLPWGDVCSVAYEERSSFATSFRYVNWLTGLFNWLCNYWASVNGTHNKWFKFSAMWCRSIQLAVLDVVKDFSVHIFRVKQSKQTILPWTWRHYNSLKHWDLLAQWHPRRLGFSAASLWELQILQLLFGIYLPDRVIVIFTGHKERYRRNMRNGDLSVYVWKMCIGEEAADTGLEDIKNSSGYV